MLKEDYGIPVYTQTAVYAREHGELDCYRASLRANTACLNAIETAIRENYRENVLNVSGVTDVLARFSQERVQYILANIIQYKIYDRRISDDSRKWAAEILDGAEVNDRAAMSNVHPAILEIFIRQTRRETASAACEEQEVLPHRQR